MGIGQIHILTHGAKVYHVARLRAKAGKAVRHLASSILNKEKYVNRNSAISIATGLAEASKTNKQPRQGSTST